MAASIRTLKLLSLLIYVSICIVCTSQSKEDSNKARTYINLKSPIPCVRRMNATHQFGCGKGDKGVYDGIVYAVRNPFELNRLKAIDDLDGKKLVLVTLPFMFEETIDLYLSKPSIVNGIVVMATIDSDPSKNGTFNYTYPDHYSPDSKDPNQPFSWYGNQTKSFIDWNDPAGTSFMFRNFDVPIYVITNEEDAKPPIENCYEKFNRKIFERADVLTGAQKFKLYRTDLLCGMRLGLEMAAAVSSNVCIRRESISHTLDDNSYCDPLGGSSYFSFLSQKPSNDLPITLLNVRLDSFTMFEYYTPAASEPVSSIIGLLSLTELLAKYRADFTKSNLLLVLFDNDAFDYGGSSRFANDLALNQFPKLFRNTSKGSEEFQLQKDNITSMIELGQLGAIGLSDSSLLYIHKDPISYGNNKTIADLIDAMQKSLTDASNKTIVPVVNINQSLPPASLQAFLKNGINLAGVFISDHDKNFKNKYYHSIFDTPESMNVVYPSNMSEQDALNYTTPFAKRLQVLMTGVAKSLYNLYTDKKVLNDQVSLDTINKLTYCIYKNTTCSYLRGIMSDSQWSTYKSLLDAYLPKNRLTFYTSVNDNQVSGKWLTQILLQFFSRNSLVEAFNATECNKESASVKKLINDTGLTVRKFVFLPNYNNLGQSLCVGSSVYGVSSVSPAFDKSDDGVLVNTDKFSAWTESSWSTREHQIQLYMFTSDFIGYVTITVGSLVFVSSLFIVYFLNKYSNRLFSFNHPEQSAEFINQ